MGFPVETIWDQPQLISSTDQTKPILSGNQWIPSKEITTGIKTTQVIIRIDREIDLPLLVCWLTLEVTIDITAVHRLELVLVEQLPDLVVMATDLPLTQWAEAETMIMTLAYGARKRPKNTIKIEIPHQLLAQEEWELSRKTVKLQVNVAVVVLQDSEMSSSLQLHSQRRARQSSLILKFRWVRMRVTSLTSSPQTRCWRAITIRRVS